MANKSFKQALFLPVVAVIGGYLALIVSDLLPSPHFFVPESCYEVTSTVHGSGETYDHQYCFKNWGFVCHVEHENFTDKALNNTGYQNKECLDNSIKFTAEHGDHHTTSIFSFKDDGQSIDGTFGMISKDASIVLTGRYSGTRIGK
ncbi:hypothetical protein WH96_17175 [Kiloniella spongiae]|uniref:Uncharacterized protein n=1 Tax=Kiloniella spongiae TaxID=1489064 RepID=A0A0H2MSH6_9PROT|nr:hypothetical protein [Kiloniella spongiae]KLN59595.1 hypothetical protein WH96_17175 [Kiloniella spongiae]